MKPMVILACALCAFAASPAMANMCKTDSARTCGTGMPLEGYCMCGDEGGTVVGSAIPPAHVMTHHPHHAMSPAPATPPAAEPATPPAAPSK